MASHLDLLLELARREDSAFAASLIGVPEREVARIEGICGIRLPVSYRDFVLRMGRGRTRFVIARDYEHDFEVACRRLPTAAYAMARYFKIAVTGDHFHSDTGEAPDYFLELGRIDDDARIVMFETREDDEGVKDEKRAQPGPVRRMSFGFCEMLTRGLFRFLVLERLRFGTTLQISDRSAVDLVATLGASGFDLALPALPGVWCLRRSDRDCALVRSSFAGANVDMATREQTVLKDFLSDFPDAAMISPTIRVPHNTRP